MKKKLSTVNDICEILSALRKKHKPGIVNFQIFGDGSCSINTPDGYVSLGQVDELYYTFERIIRINNKEIN